MHSKYKGALKILNGWPLVGRDYHEYRHKPGEYKQYEDLSYLKKGISLRMIFYNYFDADSVKILLMISFISSIGKSSR